MVLDDSVGLLQVSPVVNVPEGWSFIACEKLCCLHHLLYSFTVRGGAAWTPHRHAAASDTLDVARVKGCGDLQSRAEFTLTLLSIADPKQLETADFLHLRHIDENEGISSLSTTVSFT